MAQGFEQEGHKSAHLPRWDRLQREARKAQVGRGAHDAGVARPLPQAFDALRAAGGHPRSLPPSWQLARLPQLLVMRVLQCALNQREGVDSRRSGNPPIRPDTGCTPLRLRPAARLCRPRRSLGFLELLVGLPHPLERRFHGSRYGPLDELYIESHLCLPLSSCVRRAVLTLPTPSILPRVRLL